MLLSDESTLFFGGLKIFAFPKLFLYNIKNKMKL